MRKGVWRYYTTIQYRGILQRLRRREPELLEVVYLGACKKYQFVYVVAMDTKTSIREVAEGTEEAIDEWSLDVGAKNPNKIFCFSIKRALDGKILETRIHKILYPAEGEKADKEMKDAYLSEYLHVPEELIDIKED